MTKAVAELVSSGRQRSGILQILSAGLGLVYALVIAGCAGEPTEEPDPEPAVLPPVCAGVTASELAASLGRQVARVLTEESLDRWSCSSDGSGVRWSADLSSYDEAVASAWEIASATETRPQEVALPGADAAVAFDQRDGLGKHLLTVVSAEGVTWRIAVDAATRDEEERLAATLWSLVRGDEVAETPVPVRAPSVCRRLGPARVTAALGGRSASIPAGSSRERARSSCSTAAPTR